MAGNVYEFTPWSGPQDGLASGSRERAPDDKLKRNPPFPQKAGTKTASAGGLYPPFALTLLAPCRIDSAARLRRLLYRRKAGPVACRAFALDRLCGKRRHLISLTGVSPRDLAGGYQLAGRGHTNWELWGRWRRPGGGWVLVRIPPVDTIVAINVEQLIMAVAGVANGDAPAALIDAKGTTGFVALDERGDMRGDGGATRISLC
jgi:hypothetical protein